jgi:hypothetical protein
MKRSDKNLLIKILSLMLRYGVMCQVDGLENPQKLMGINIEDGNVLFKFLRKQCHGRKAFIHCTIDCIKPYLRNASTLTYKELIEYSKSKDKTTWCLKHYLCPMNLTDNHEAIAIINIFDNGLAIRAPKGMYKGY